MMYVFVTFALMNESTKIANASGNLSREGTAYTCKQNKYGKSTITSDGHSHISNIKGVIHNADKITLTRAGCFFMESPAGEFLVEHGDVNVDTVRKNREPKLWIIK
jgi:hypothetical protein